MEGSDDPWPEHPMTRALIYNQSISFFAETREHWREKFLKGDRPADRLNHYTATGLIGSGWIWNAPNIDEITCGTNQLVQWDHTDNIISGALIFGFGRIWNDFRHRIWALG